MVSFLINQSFSSVKQMIFFLNLMFFVSDAISDLLTGVEHELFDDDF